jgi:linoleoyl-CoA desaturase
VSEYFKTTQQSKAGDGKLIMKTIIMLLLFFVPLGVIIFAPIENVFLLFVLYILNGLGMVGIGMGVMHDAIHGSFTKNTKVNKLMTYVSVVIGANDEVWRLQHNVLHHSFTNIEGHDDDIHASFLLRFSPHARKYKIHKYQHYYAWILYGLTSLMWVTVNDVEKFARYYKMGLVPDRKTYINGMIKIIALKFVYYSYTLILPMIFTPFSPLTIVLAFLAMHFVTGFIIAVVFQAAHVTPSADFPMPDESGKMESVRLEHQLRTTCNFAPKSKWLFWLVGGLTNQIEHHLFPTISHVHYRELAPIVKKTAEEYGLPYHNSGSFFAAIAAHFRMLRDLGRMELQPIPVRNN